MDPETVQRILALNRQFYQTFAGQFSATRQRIQPGVRHLLPSLLKAQAILDLGCGNSELARQLGKSGYTGSYVGLDFSAGLLAEIHKSPPSLPRAAFLQVDLSEPGWETAVKGHTFDAILAFAVLHHLPGLALRRQILERVHSLLSPEGAFLFSNWQFLSSEKLAQRIQPWEKAGISEAEVEEGDYLLDWRGGGEGLRYVHHFHLSELITLAQETSFTIQETFYSDGENERLSLYQVWKPA